MKHIIEINEENNTYYIDEKTYKVYKINKKGKKYEVKKIKGKRGNYYSFYSQKEDESRIKRYRIFNSFIIGKYILNIKEGMFLSYKDGNVNNDSIENIQINNLNKICNKWVDLKNYEKEYCISANGKIFSKETLTLYTISKDRYGYEYTCLHSKVYYIHHLVYESYTPNFKKINDYVVDHIDNNPSNNSYDNLQYIHSTVNLTKDHKSKNGLPTGVTMYENFYRAHITYTLDNIQYKHKWLGNFDTKEEASEAYLKAFKMIQNKHNPIPEYDKNKKIEYCFKNNKWFYAENHKAKIIKNIKYFNTPQDVENYIQNNNSTLYLNKKIKELEKKLITQTKRYNEYNIKQQSKINDLNNINEKLKQEKKELLNDLNKQILKNKELIEKYNLTKVQYKEKSMSYQERLQDFVNKENYQKNSYNECYTINIPYSDGKRYYLASFANFDIVQELNEIINEHKYQNNFIEWFNDFKENKLQYYLDKDKAYRIQKDNIKQDRKGYKWFSPRNCWRVNKRYHNKDYMLGYFKNENCCKMMVAEANNALEAGIFEKWVEDINEHRERIKKLFED